MIRPSSARHRAAFVLLLASAVFAACAPDTSGGMPQINADAATAAFAARPANGAGHAPSLQRDTNPSGEPVPDTTAAGKAGQRYIVTLLQPGVGAMSASQATAAAQRALLRVPKSEGQLLYVYTRALRGFAAILTPEAAEHLAATGEYRVVADKWVHATTEVQNDPPSWGLDRLDGVNDHQYRFDQTGAGVHIYLIDSGIRMSHHDFGTRADKFLDMVGGDGTDPDGHGTHVAGTVGGATFGVAKQASIHSVRVLDENGNGKWSDVIQAIDSVIIRGKRPAVINLSLGSGTFLPADTAVQRAVQAGITVVVAAGNEYHTDACDVSPAREPVAITVGATTDDDVLASFSNIGACIDILAPGVAITSASNLDDDSTAVMSGTSMAAPHVTGAVALFLQNNSAAKPAVVTGALLAAAARGKIRDVGEGTPNLLLQTMP